MLATITVTGLGDRVLNGDGQVTLREAILAANTDTSVDGSTAGRGDDIIIFDPSNIPGEILIANGPLVIESNIEIQGPGASELTLNARGVSQVLVFDRGTSILVGAKITGGLQGDSSRSGGGIVVDEFARATLNEVIVTNNHSRGDGGGIAVSGSITILNSVIDGNTADGNGAGIVVDSDLVWIGNSSISGNIAGDNGGGLLVTSNGEAVLVQSTLVENRAGSGGGGIRGIGSVAMSNSIVAENMAPAGPDFLASGSNTRFSLIGDGTDSTDLGDGIDGNLVGIKASPIDPQLNAAGDHGGAIVSRALTVGSPAINRGSNSLAVDDRGTPLVTEQRGPGYDRILDGTVDMGAVEFGPHTFIPDTISDLDDGQLANGHDSLRELITQANKSPGHDFILLPSNLGNEYALAGTQLPTITDHLTLDRLMDDAPLQSINVGALRAGDIKINGQGQSRVFQIAADTNVTIARMTILGGAANDGAGIFSEGNLRLDRVAMTDNVATREGGGVNIRQGTLAVRDSLFSSNRADVGGGIVVGAGSAEVVNSTMSDNRADSEGGAIASAGTLHIGNSTIVNNVAGIRGGGLVALNTSTELANTAIALNNAASGPDIFGRVTSLGNSLLGIDSDSVGLIDGQNGDQVGTAGQPLDPVLGSLGNNGGWTASHLPGPGSPLIDRGRDALAVDTLGVPIINDQRHGYVPRIAGASVDIGAIEVFQGTLTVTTLADEDDGRLGLGTGDSLREVLHASNVIPGENHVDFDASLARGTIALGGAHMHIADSVNIVSPTGVDSITVDAGNQSQILHSHADINVTGLTFSRGNGIVAGSEGGAIMALDGAVSLSHVSLVNNRALSAGGGLYSIATDPITISNSTIHGNRSGGCGAGVFARFGTVDIVESDFENNVADGSSSAACLGRLGGGALMSLVLAGAGNLGVTIASSTFSTNSTTGSGGAIDSRSDVLIDDSTFSDNSAFDTGFNFDRGGAINSDSILTVANSQFDGNFADDDGGALRAGGSTSVVDSTLENNTADRRGGAITAGQNFGTPSNDVLTLSNTTIANNTSGSSGGGVYSFGAAIISDSLISGNDSSGHAGGIAIDNLALVDSQVTNSRFQSNHAIGSGGGIYVENANVSIANSEFDSNEAAIGGGIYVRELNSQINEFPNITIQDTTVTNNEALGCGGGMRFLEANVLVERVEVSGNSTTGEANCVLQAFGGAGVASAPPNTPTLQIFKDSTFSGNTSALDGGGLLINTNAMVINTTVSGNQAAGRGGGIASARGNLQVTNSTVVDNRAETGSGGIDNDDPIQQPSSVFVMNSIVAENFSSASGAELPSDVLGDFESSSAHNLIGVGLGNLDQGVNDTQAGTLAAPLDPMLELLADNGGPTLTHALMIDSPAIDSGDNALAVDETLAQLANDQRGSGFQRIHNATVDVGAFESAFEVQTHLFYNNSAFDSNDPATGVADDAAIATDKLPLLPGETATAANLSSFARGVNGIMVDLPGGIPGAIDPTDFSFRIGNESDTDNWQLGPVPTVTVRAGEGVGGSNRVTLTWSDRAISAIWLELTVLAGSDTGLGFDHVVYYGSAIGDVSGEGQVNAIDFSAARANPKTFLESALIDDPHDLNRDQRVDVADLVVVRDHATTLATQLNMIVPVSNGGNLVAGKTGSPIVLSVVSNSSRNVELRRDSSASAPDSIHDEQDHAAHVDALMAIAYAPSATQPILRLDVSDIDELHVGMIDPDAI